VSERHAQRARPPGRARSQHFLRKPVAAELVRDACLGSSDLVVDLGAGTGRLTEELAGAAGRVVAVELDPHLARRLRGRWANVEVRCADAASVQLPHEPFRVVANLPFDRTNDVLRHLLDDPRVPLVRADLVVQWGVAVKRGLPWPSTVNGVLWGAWYSARIARRLPRSAFRPTPSVDAGVLVLERRARPLVAESRASEYRRFVASGFRRGLRGAARVEPRQLDPHEWAALFTGASAAKPARARRVASAARAARRARET
jgi:23S rRNA (adenine-N6)-dimethyltransferase